MRMLLRQAAVIGLAAASIAMLPGVASAALTVRALWNMDSLPTMVDSAGGDNNGTTRDITLSGGGYSFNGSTSLATAPDNANLDPGSAAIRLTARVRFTAFPHMGRTFDVVRKGVSTSAGGDYKLEIARGANSQTAVASCTFKDAGGVAATVKGTVNLAGTGLQTITCTKTATSVQVTAGGQTRTLNRALGSISNASAVFVGGKGDGSDPFAGIIDFVKIEIG